MLPTPQGFASRLWSRGFLALAGLAVQVVGSVLLVVCRLAVAAEVDAAKCRVPWEWQASSPSNEDQHLGNYYWNRDLNRNRIDDILERGPLSDGHPGYGVLAPRDGPVDLVVALNECIPEERLRALVRSWDVGTDRAYFGTYLPIVVLPQVNRVPNVLRHIAADKKVAMVEWGEPLIPFLEAAKRTIRWSELPRPSDLKEIGVAVIDTGVAPRRKTDGDFLGQGIEPSKVPSAIDQSLDAIAASSAWKVGAACSEGDPACGHGSAVVTLLTAGAAKSSGEQGDRGVAPGVSILDIKACAENRCPPAAVFRALEAVLDIRSNVHVVNMSIGGCVDDDGTSSYPQMVDRVAASGVIVVAAMGNKGSCGITGDTSRKLVARPASATLAVVVSGVDDRSSVTKPYLQNLVGPRCAGSEPREHAFLTRKPDVLAPAQSIRTSQGTWSGTSFATPLVVGAIAKARTSGRAFSVCDVKCALVVSSQAFIGSEGFKGWHAEYGWGVLDDREFFSSVRGKRQFKCDLADRCEDRIRVMNGVGKPQYLSEPETACVR